MSSCIPGIHEERKTFYLLLHEDSTGLAPGAPSAAYPWLCTIQHVTSSILAACDRPEQPSLLLQPSPGKGVIRGNSWHLPCRPLPCAGSLRTASEECVHPHRLHPPTPNATSAFLPCPLGALQEEWGEEAPLLSARGKERFDWALLIQCDFSPPLRWPGTSGAPWEVCGETGEGPPPASAQGGPFDWALLIPRSLVLRPSAGPAPVVPSFLALNPGQVYR